MLRAERLGVEQRVKAAGLHLCGEGFMGGVSEGLHTGTTSGFNIVRTIVYEQDVFWNGIEPGGGMGVDGMLRLGNFERMRKGDMVSEAGQARGSFSTHAMR